MFILYQTIISVILIFSPLIIIFRILRNKEDKKRFIEKFSIPTKKKLNGRLVWFHGASVGEILSVIPLIRFYEKNKYVKQILITSSTVSSSKIVEKFKFKKTIHQFYPIDYFPLTNKFLNYWKPSVGIFIDSEIWPLMFKDMKKKNIPIFLLNARLTKKTFNKWKKIQTFSKQIFDLITIAYPQNLETETYLKNLSEVKINTIGNLKFAQNFDKNLDKINKKLNLEFKKRKLWVASSTHKKEELFCAETHLELKKKYNNLTTIIIPRHIHRAKKIKTDLENLGLSVAAHTSSIKTLKHIDIYLVDTFGETNKFYNISASVFLGGSLVKRGGQNPLEPARFGAKILHGPNTENFKDVYNQLKSLNISKKIYTPKQLASSISFKKNLKTGIIIKNIGEKIFKKTVKELNNQIFNEFKKT